MDNIFSNFVMVEMWQKGLRENESGWLINGIFKMSIPQKPNLNFFVINQPVQLFWCWRGNFWGQFSRLVFKALTANVR